MQGLLELAALLARGGAVCELATLSVDGIVHGERVTVVESLALHVKGLDLVGKGLEISSRLSAISPPPRLAAAVEEVRRPALTAPEGSCGEICVPPSCATAGEP